MRAAREHIHPDAGGTIKLSGRCERSFEYEWHYHVEVELTLIQGSRGMRYVGDNVAPYQHGDMVLLGSMLPHAWQSDASTSRDDMHRSVCIQFSPTLLTPLSQTVPEIQPVVQLINRARYGLFFADATRQEVQDDMHALKALTPRRRIAALLGILTCLSEANNVRPISQTHFHADNPPQTQNRVDEICTFISHHYMNRLTLSQIAHTVNLSESTCTRLFKRVKGRTIVEHIQELKIGMACRLLLESDATISQVAMDCGFESIPYFNRVFKQIKTMTPSEFRRMHGCGKPTF